MIKAAENTIAPHICRNEQTYICSRGHTQKNTKVSTESAIDVVVRLFVLGMGEYDLCIVHLYHLAEQEVRRFICNTEGLLHIVRDHYYGHFMLQLGAELLYLAR